MNVTMWFIISLRAGIEKTFLAVALLLAIGMLLPLSRTLLFRGNEVKYGKAIITAMIIRRRI